MPRTARKRNRKEPERADEAQGEKQGAAHVSPVTRLYRHALESVFKFLTLADLSRVLSVSRSWSAAVRSMKSIGALYDGRSAPYLIISSPLASHAGEWIKYDCISLSDLFLLSRPPFAFSAPSHAL